MQWSCLIFYLFIVIFTALTLDAAIFYDFIDKVGRHREASSLRVCLLLFYSFEIGCRRFFYVFCLLALTVESYGFTR